MKTNAALADATDLTEDMPEGWSWATLGQISEVNPRFTDTYAADDIDVTFLPMRCVAELTGILDLSITKKLSEVRKGYTNFREGDLLFAKITPCMENGKIVVARNLRNGMGFGSTEFHVIRPFAGFPPEFLFYYLLQDGIRKEAQRSMTGTAGQLRVSANFIREIRIPIPPLSELYRIIKKIEELFSRLDAGLDNLKMVKAQLKHYRQSVLKHAFEGKLTQIWRETHKDESPPTSAHIDQIGGIRRWFRQTELAERFPDAHELCEMPDTWRWARFRDILNGTLQNGLYKESKYFSHAQGVGFLDIKGLYKGYVVDFQGIRRVELSDEERKKYALENNDILINRVSKKPEGVGKTALVKNLEEVIVFESNMMRVKIDDANFSSSFINYYLNSPRARSQILRRAKMTQQASINQADIGSIFVPVPPLLEQQKAVEMIELCLSKADAAEKNVGETSRKAERLRQNILTTAFRGRLVRQDPNDESAAALLEHIESPKQRERTRKETADLSKAKQTVLFHYAK